MPSPTSSGPPRRPRSLQPPPRKTKSSPRKNHKVHEVTRGYTGWFSATLFYVDTDSILTLSSRFSHLNGCVQVFLSFTEYTLLGFTKFYKVLLLFGFTGFYWVLLGFTGFYWFMKNSWVSLGFTRFNQKLLGFTEFYWGFTGFYWVSFGFTRFYGVLLGFTGFY